MWGASVIEQLRQNMRREAEAEAEAERSKPRASGMARAFDLKGVLNPRTLLAHPQFILVVSVWGAALLGLSVLALSSVDIARVSMVLGLGALGFAAKFVYAAVAALLGGVGAFICAWLAVRLGGKARTPRLAPASQDADIRPIDLTELGSESLDAPLDETLLSKSQNTPGDEDEWVEADEVAPDFEEHRALAEEDPVLELNELSELVDPARTPPEELEKVSQDHWETEEEIEDAEDASDELVASSPPSLDFDAFRAVLAEEAALDESEIAEPSQPDEAQAQSQAQAGSFASQTPASVAKLREAPPQELSLIQLVERFAAALHDVQDRSPQDLATDKITRENAQREQALVQALKALELFTDGAGPSASNDEPNAAELGDTERDLRDALSKLQNVRGAA